MRVVARWVLLGMAAVHVAEAIELRRRRARLTSLPTPEPGSNGAPSGKLEVVSVAGLDVDDETLLGVGQEMEATGVQVVDLVPGDLPADRVLRLLRRVEPHRVGTEPYYTPGGAHEAVVLHPSLTERAGSPADEPRDRGRLVRRTVHAQRYAPTASAVRLAPSLRAAPSTPEGRWRELEELSAPFWPYAAGAPILVGFETAHLLAMTAGLFVAPWAAIAALATWSAQPAVVLGGTSPSPQQAPLQVGLRRLPNAWLDNLRTTVAGAKATRARAEERARVPVPVAPPEDVLFEARRDACPWCDSTDIVGRLDIGDLLQNKPGTFHLDECTACGHIFQNPALTIAGLDHFYEDAYDGLGEELAENSFAALGAIYRSRVESLARQHEPRAWLDVGTGHAHFCLAARERWPDLTIDGLDMSDTVEEAQRRGRIDRAYLGFFPEMADDLPRKYDTLSMHHYIEHTREPRRELEAAAKVVEPGGYFMIEMPDPASPWSKRLGRFWWQWGQPQHQHFVTCEEMVKALGEVGFDVVSVERGPATMGGDLFNSIGLVLQERARSPHLPWLPTVSFGHRVKRGAMYVGSLPALAVTKVADEIKDTLRRSRPESSAGNAYRIVSRRRS